MDIHFIQVILPLRLQWTPFYSCREEVCRGDIVTVAFAGRKYNGVVSAYDCRPDISSDSIKEIQSVRRDLPRIGGKELELWGFMASYYACTIGEVFRAAYPAGKLKGEIAAAARLARLADRIRRIEEDLGRRHSDKVRERLLDEKSRLEAMLPAQGPAGSVSDMKSAACTDAGTPQPGKPVLLCGDARYRKYGEIISRCRADGRQVLVLSPETALCEQLGREIGRAADHAGIVHHGRTDTYITEVSAALRRGEPLTVIGTRMSVFLPFTNLGAIIIDEEQDPSFKQSDPAPRYNARDCAVYMGTIHKAEVCLGSSLPSLESLHNILTGKYLSDIDLDGILRHKAEFIDTEAEWKKHGMYGYFSRKLTDMISACTGKVCLIRGWEKTGELKEQADTLFPDREIVIMTLSELKKNGSGGAELTAVMQIDALADKDDFRADERLLQTVAMMEHLCCKDLGGTRGRLVIQTAGMSRFSEERSYAALLEERKEFSFPPYSRMVDVRDRDGRIIGRHFLKKGDGLAEAKAAIREALAQDCYMDVDP